MERNVLRQTSGGVIFFVFYDANIRLPDARSVTARLGMYDLYSYSEGFVRVERSVCVAGVFFFFFFVPAVRSWAARGLTHCCKYNRQQMLNARREVTVCRSRYYNNFNEPLGKRETLNRVDCSSREGSWMKNVSDVAWKKNI